MLYFLNDVEEGGETAFPVANNETFSIEVRICANHTCRETFCTQSPGMYSYSYFFGHYHQNKTNFHSV